MATEEKDINLGNFLKNFTFQNEPGKIQIDTAIFLQVASLLKLDVDLTILTRKLR